MLLLGVAITISTTNSPITAAIQWIRDKVNSQANLNIGQTNPANIVKPPDASSQPTNPNNIIKDVPTTAVDFSSGINPSAMIVNYTGSSNAA